MISRVQYFFRRRRGLPRWWEEAVLVVARSTRWKTRTKSLSSCSADLPVALASLSSSASSAVWWCVGGGRLLVSKTTPALRFGPAPPACKGKVILKDLRRECNVILLQFFSLPRDEELHAVLSSQLSRVLVEGLGAKKWWEGWERWWRGRRECFQIQTRDKILPLKPPKTPWLKLGKSSTLLFGSDFARESRWITFYSDRCTFAMEGDDTARKSIMMEQSCPHLSHITHS